MPIAARLWVADWEGMPTPYREMVIERAMPIIYEAVRPKMTPGQMFQSFSRNVPVNAPEILRWPFELVQVNGDMGEVESVDYVAWRRPS